MSTLVYEAMQVEIGATERWPEDVRLYQQYQVEQMTFPDYAACLSVKSFLHMCGLKFTTELRINAEEMSPSGRVPFIKIGPFLISEMEPIIACVHTRGFQLSADLTDVQKSELKAYMSLVGSTLVNAEHCLAWCDTNVANQVRVFHLWWEHAMANLTLGVHPFWNPDWRPACALTYVFGIYVTKLRYGSLYPWPLNYLLPLKKQWDVRSRLASLDWAKKTFEEVCDEVVTCCQALSERLDKQEYFFGDRPTELDALVFGHLFTLLTTDLPNPEFAHIIGKFPNLVNFCKRIDAKYFKELHNDY